MATALEQLACENASENVLVAAFLAPIRSFFGISKHETLFAFAWAVIIILWLVVYFVVPISFLNSVNGFKSGSRTVISTLVIFFFVVVGYVLWTRDRACRVKREKAKYYVQGHRPYQPKYLTQAIERVQSEDKNRMREVTPWKPQKPLETIAED